MKIFIMVFAAILASQACNKPNNKTAPATSITGTWELRRTYGGNILPSTLPAGNGNKLSFDGTVFKVYTNGQLTTSDTYHIEAAAGLQYIVYGDNPQPLSRDLFSINDDSLTLQPTHPDFSTRVYLKISDEPVHTLP